MSQDLKCRVCGEPIRTTYQQRPVCNKQLTGRNCFNTLRVAEDEARQKLEYLGKSPDEISTYIENFM